MIHKSQNKGFTIADLQKLLNEDIEETLSQVPLIKPSGETAQIKAYSQFLPIPQSTDEDDENDFVPYVVTKIQTGEKNETDPFVITVGLIICVCNFGMNREGHFDLLNIIQRLENRFARRSYVGNFEVQPSFEFALQESDTHPFYYAGVILKFNAPKSIKEDDFFA
ncbi:MAG: hypothetical protein Q4B62_05260 [Clostridiaceae bacterium]|nr:hypothetical protein [Clostridiaceae bacterium]